MDETKDDSEIALRRNEAGKPVLWQLKEVGIEYVPGSVILILRGATDQTAWLADDLEQVQIPLKPNQLKNLQEAFATAALALQNELHPSDGTN